MKKKIVLSMFCVLLSFMLLACGGGGVPIDENAIRINVGPEPDSIDPALNSSMDGGVYIAHAFEGLTIKGKDGITNGVAESWDVSNDGLTYTFKIRDNAKWSDGVPVTANDFVYSWQRVVDPITASEYGYQLAPLKNATAITAGEMELDTLGVRAIDDKTLEVTLVAPTAYILELLSFYTFSPVRQDIIEAHGDKWTLTAETYIGNGPFKMIERSIDDKIVMAKNETYWNAAETLPTQLVFVLMQNENAAVAGIKEGSLHFATGPPPQDIPALVEEGIVQIHPQLGTYYYVINFTNEITKDARVRRALNLVIDRQYIVDEVTKGGQVPAGAFVPTGVNDVTGDFRENGGDYYSVDPADYEANIAEAKVLMAEAGYPDGKGFPVLEFKSNSGAGHSSIFEAIQQMWKESLGIDSILTQEEWAVFQQTRNDKNFVIARHGWIGDYNDPMTFIDVFVSDSPQNNGGYSNAKFDEYINIAKTTGDQSVRMKAMHDAEDILFAEMGLIPLYYYTQALLVSPSIKGIVFDYLGKHKFNYAYIEE